MIQNLILFLLGGCFTFTATAGVMLFLKSGDDRLKRLLAYLYFFYTILFLKDLLLIVPSFEKSDYISKLLITIDNWAVIGCVMYVLEFAHPDSTNLKRISLHILPFFICSLLYGITKYELIFKISCLWNLIYSIGGYIYYFRFQRKYNQYIVDNYSYLETLQIKWMNKVIVVFLFYAIIWNISAGLTNSLIDCIYLLCSLIVWVIVFKHGYVQLRVVQIIDEPSEHDSTENSPLFMEQLEEVMINNQLFLNPKLTISDVLNEINTNRTYLSNYLNNTLHLSFCDYINKYRIEFASTLLSNPKNNDTLEVIAEKSGFNSLSTFRRNFEKTYGCTPNTYRKKL